MQQKTTIPQCLVDLDENVKEIRELIPNDADRKEYEHALLILARQEKLIEDLRDILTNHHHVTAVRVHKALERIDADEIPF